MFPISYQIWPNDKQNFWTSYSDTYNLYYRCGEDRGPLPIPLNSHKVLNFTTTVTTDLNIIIMGDSIAVQLGQGFQEASGTADENRHVYRYSWGTHEGLSIAAPVRGGGAVAFWRIVDMWRRKNEGKPLPNLSGGGWLRQDAITLLNHSFCREQSELDNCTTSHQFFTKVKVFEVLIFWVPAGWIGYASVDEQSLKETVLMAEEFFQAQAVIFVAPGFTNNANSLEEVELASRRIRTFSNIWWERRSNDDTKNGTGSVKFVEILEFGNFSISLLKANAEAIGYNASDEKQLVYEMLCCQRYNMRIAQVCAERVTSGSKSCKKNLLSLDGMHLCMKTISGRLFAGLSCIISCLFNKNTSRYDRRTCSKKCNEDFMSLKPLILD